jgi:hypothetical protein
MTEAPAIFLRTPLRSCTSVMPTWLESSWFDYPVTRPITLRHFNIAFLVLGVFYVVYATLISIVAVGYEPFTFLSANFNDSATLWYNGIPIVSLGNSGTITCNYSTIAVNDGNVSPVFKLIKALDTNTRYYSGYTLQGFWDTSSNAEVNGFSYSNNPLSNCTVGTLQMTQSIYTTVQDQVHTPLQILSAKL